MSRSLFADLKASLNKFQKARTSAYGASQEALRNAKRAIFAIHRDDWATADNALKTAEHQLRIVQKLVIREPKVRFDGAVHAAMEEYAEARMYADIVRAHSLMPINGIRLTPEEHVGALADLTGELVRRAVAQATLRQTQEVLTIRKVVQGIIEHFLELHLTGMLRQKFDDAKRNLNRIEDIYYQLTLR